MNFFPFLINASKNRSHRAENSLTESGLSHRVAFRRREVILKLQFFNFSRNPRKRLNENKKMRGKYL
ncbi:hypothetical cytosolic protein [Syntrophus aciditrophicus SB]|uniref:Hypothetical cytosolic protein n=1 Tax=Syntrophus aciditrophicus (strain SB) TaxID=56780 RepID=Q2LR35_SYNAS|nr:hypothetical cytosolic protein [Syntrophus aciditrophicus SB]